MKETKIIWTDENNVCNCYLDIDGGRCIGTKEKDLCDWRKTVLSILLSEDKHSSKEKQRSLPTQLLLSFVPTAIYTLLQQSK